MGDRKSGAGSRAEAPLQKADTTPPLYFSSNTPVLLTSGSLAPPRGLWQSMYKLHRRAISSNVSGAVRPRMRESKVANFA
jgi:hypothetical protein